MYTEDQLLPLSGLQHLAFCERRWALVQIEQQWEDNLFTVEGSLLHEKAHSATIESRPGALIRRTLPLHSLRLGLSGQADVVEFLPVDTAAQGIAVPHRKGFWRACPIEYKRSRDRNGSSAYRIQLCAQALCLEEMLGTPVLTGAVFDGKSKRRQEIQLDPALRSEVERLAARMHLLYAEGKTPAAVYARKCESCSMKPVCLPEAAERSSVRHYLSRAVSINLSQQAVEGDPR